MFGMNGWCKEPNNAGNGSDCPKNAQNSEDRTTGDLISRAAAIDAICNSGCRSKFCGLPCDDVAALKALPSAQPEQRWIPCSERLPEHGGWYIVTRRITKDNDRCVGLLWYSTAHGWEWDNAIAWMPLPEPWKEGEE